MGAKSYEDVVAWQVGHAVTLEVYRWTRTFPREEFYGLVQQIRRAASSVPANIVEGFARRKPYDKARLYNIAEGSADELGYWIRLATDLDYGEDPGALREKVKSSAQLLRRLTEATLARAGRRPPGGE